MSSSSSHHSDPTTTTAAATTAADSNVTKNTVVASTDAPVSTSSAIVGSLRRAREYWTPVRAKSAFLSKGVLTPDEFVKAGDELCYRCPTWSWESGDPARAKSFLPPDKQFLITRSVPSTSRVDSIEQSLTLTALNDDDGEDDDWMVSNVVKTCGEDDDDALLEDEFDILDINEEGEVVVEQKNKKKIQADDPPAAPVASATGADKDTTNYPDDEEYADMADFEDDNILLDDDDDNHHNNEAGSGAGGGTAAATASTTTVPTRRYDISITYDKYYQTPRVWMTGLSEQQQPLTVEELMEDVVTDYRHKTVTMEPHPHSSGRQASIHPCQHAKVMKVIVQNLMKASTDSGGSGDSNNNSNKDSGESAGGDRGRGVDVTQYLFIFLKFVSSIIPTVNYDFTMDVQADTSK